MLLAAGVAGCDSGETVACEIGDARGETVANTGIGAWPAALSWREIWRAGGIDEIQQLALPADIAVGPDGSVAIADWGVGEVIVLEADGAWRGPVMTRGGCPGEVQAPAAVTWVDARTLLVLDFGAARLITLDLSSRSASTTQVDPAFLSPAFMAGEVAFVAIQPDRSVWLESPGAVEDGWAERFFVRWSPETAVHDTVGRSRARVLQSITLPAWPRPPMGGGERASRLDAPHR